MKNVLIRSGVLLLALALAACGANAPATQAPTDGAATLPTTAPAAGQPDPMVPTAGTDVMDDALAAGDTLVTAAANDPRFSTLVGLLETSGLSATLAGPGPFTVFAPTNDAFLALPPDTLTVLAQNPALLEEVLLYHVVGGAILSTDIDSATTVVTASGQDLSVEASNGTVTINNSAQVIAPDIEVGNGVIHGIDTVLLPPDLVLPPAS